MCFDPLNRGDGMLDKHKLLADASVKPLFVSLWSLQPLELGALRQSGHWP